MHSVTSANFRCFPQKNLPDINYGISENLDGMEMGKLQNAECGLLELRIYHKIKFFLRYDGIS